MTVTGNIHVIRSEHFAVMKDGAIVCNSGHFNVELDIPSLEKQAKKRRHGQAWRGRIYAPEKWSPGQPPGRRPARKLATAEGHPSSVMDMSFANQALGAEYIVKNYKHLEKKVYPVPPAIDKEIARLKLAGMGVRSIR